MQCKSLSRLHTGVVFPCTLCLNTLHRRIARPSVLCRVAGRRSSTSFIENLHAIVPAPWRNTRQETPPAAFNLKPCLRQSWFFFFFSPMFCFWKRWCDDAQKNSTMGNIKPPTVTRFVETTGKRQVTNRQTFNNIFLLFLLTSSSLRLMRLAMAAGNTVRSLSGMLSRWSRWQLNSCWKKKTNTVFFFK